MGDRFIVVGTTGSGKTALAREIARLVGAPHVELDALFWEPHWTQAPDDVFRARVAAAVAQPRWVADGNYVRLVYDLVWRAADTLVWLDYSIARVYWQLLRRTVGRVISGEELWHGNRESLRTAFLSRESLFVWALRSHWRHRRQWVYRLRQPRHAHLRVIRLRSPHEADAYLRTLPRVHAST